MRQLNQNELKKVSGGSSSLSSKLNNSKVKDIINRFIAMLEVS
ncbi:bacteriocin [Erwinia endophytica]|nr:bacteriocin [Erwinia endophytica]